MSMESCSLGTTTLQEQIFFPCWIMSWDFQRPSKKIEGNFLNSGLNPILLNINKLKPDEFLHSTPKGLKVQIQGGRDEI
jgi:hypothetical protein